MTFALWAKRRPGGMLDGAVRRPRGIYCRWLRRALEDMGEDASKTQPYYEPWIAAISQNLIDATASTQLEEIWQSAWKTVAAREQLWRGLPMAEHVRVRALMPPGHVAPLPILPWQNRHYRA